MTDDAPPDVRLHAAELQMRRALGLDQETPPVSHPTYSPTPSNGYISGVTLRATAMFPSPSFIVTAAPAFSNWTPHGTRCGSKPMRARKPSGCWLTRETSSTISRRSSAMSVLQETR